MTIHSTSAERVRSALSYLSPEDRDDWVKYGMCIKGEFGPEGFDLWDAWGSQSDKHNASSAKSVWKSLKTDGKRTIGTLFYDAKAAGWTLSGSSTEQCERQLHGGSAHWRARSPSRFGRRFGFPVTGAARALVTGLNGSAAVRWTRPTDAKPSHRAAAQGLCQRLSRDRLSDPRPRLEPSASVRHQTQCLDQWAEALEVLLDKLVQVRRAYRRRSEAVVT